MADAAKPGYRTTEFWVTLIVTVLLAVSGAGLLGEESKALKAIEALLAVAAALGYTAARSKLKAESAPPSA